MNGSPLVERLDDKKRTHANSLPASSAPGDRSAAIAEFPAAS
jgi:hypothetical protein